MELNPEALELIMAKQAVDLTDADIDALIAHFRAQREQFALNEAAGKRANSKPKKLADPSLASILDGIV